MHRCNIYFSILWVLSCLASCQKDDIHFYLYTRNNPKDYDTLLPNGTIGHLDPTKDIKIMTHGWMDSGFSGWLMNSKDRLLGLEDVNVIIIDYKKIADNIFFNIVAAKAKMIGVYAADLINGLTENHNVDPNQVHAIAHSLGCHVIGFLGKNIANGRKMARLTGLEPAAPYFSEQTPENRLNKSDAQFVDVVHTNGGSLNDGALGFLEPLGDVDIYVNGGMEQPGCIGGGGLACSHNKAAGYFVETITAVKQFNSYPCPNDTLFESGDCLECGSGCNYMGYNADENPSGIFYLATRASSPILAVPLQVHIKVGSDQNSTKGELAIFFNSDDYQNEGYTIFANEVLTADDDIMKVMGVKPPSAHLRSIDLNYTISADTNTNSEPLYISAIEVFDPISSVRYHYAGNEIGLPSGKIVEIQLTASHY